MAILKSVRKRLKTGLETVAKTVVAAIPDKESRPELTIPEIELLRHFYGILAPTVEKELSTIPADQLGPGYADRIKARLERIPDYLGRRKNPSPSTFQTLNGVLSETNVRGIYQGSQFVEYPAPVQETLITIRGRVQAFHASCLGL